MVMDVVHCYEKIYGVRKIPLRIAGVKGQICEEISSSSSSGSK
jgi:hypothetical protein